MRNLVYFIFLVALSILFSLNSLAQNKIYTTKRIGSVAPRIDGLLNDSVWANVEWSSRLIQREPNEGKEATQQTAFKILYDDNNLYVAIRAYDTEPNKIDRRMSRRDGFEGDWVEISIDSRNDKMTAYSFTASVSGVKGDEAITRDGSNWDQSWDPIWYLKTSIDSEGWIAEMKIPFTQLRFDDKNEYIWGLEVMRRLFREDEHSQWSLIPKDSPGWVSRFGELVGIKNIHPRKQVEIVPYVVGGLEKSEKDNDNPFSKALKATGNIGLDGKIGVSNNFTLDFTINPDFGQVEADPSEVNLSAFETYFGEQRPFFIEGRNILNFQISGGGNSYSSDNLFYSRRVGRSPQRPPDDADDTYYDTPNNTMILGAFKLTGKTKNGWSIGVMESLTRKEEAEVDYLGQRSKIAVEPLTNYFTTRLQKDINKGNTIIGGMITATNRNLEDSAFNDLHRSAYTGGLDFRQNWKDKTYYLSLKANFSLVEGSKEAILNTQEAPQRYFQRPDVTHAAIDSSKTSLAGNAGIIEFGKQGGGHIRYVAWLTWRSPNFELNDMGFQRYADNLFQVFWMSYRIWEPFSIFRNINFNLNQWASWNYNGDMLFEGGNVNFNTQLKNFWSFSGGISFDGKNKSQTFLRGGPLTVGDAGLSAWMYVETDQRKKINFEFSASTNSGIGGHWRGNSYELSIEYRPINALELQFNPSFSIWETQTQYVQSLDHDNITDYILANLYQETISFSFRLNYNITPDLSIQYYGSPFLSAGIYSKFKKIIDPKAKKYNDRIRFLLPNEISFNHEDDQYSIAGIDETIDNPNFNSLQFKSNFVVRWEYTPGSTVYLVWSQNRNNSGIPGRMVIDNDFQTLFDNTANDIFMIKFSYCFKR